jgi:putative transcriptional regulator
MTYITARIRKSDGKVVRVHDDGREEVMDEPPIRPMTEEEILAAAESDPDARPLTDEQLAKMRRVPLSRPIRFRLGLSQEEFAARYHIPVGTLRDWEQGRFEPDAAARAYLHVIAQEPEVVRRALEAGPPRVRAPAA